MKQFPLILLLSLGSIFMPWEGRAMMEEGKEEKKAEWKKEVTQERKEEEIEALRQEPGNPQLSPSVATEISHEEISKEEENSPSSIDTPASEENLLDPNVVSQKTGEAKEMLLFLKQNPSEVIGQEVIDFWQERAEAFQEAFEQAQGQELLKDLELKNLKNLVEVSEHLVQELEQRASRSPTSRVVRQLDPEFRKEQPPITSLLKRESSDSSWGSHGAQETKKSFSLKKEGAIVEPQRDIQGFWQEWDKKGKEVIGLQPKRKELLDLEQAMDLSDEVTLAETKKIEKEQALERKKENPTLIKNISLSYYRHTPSIRSKYQAVLQLRDDLLETLKERSQKERELKEVTGNPLKYLSGSQARRQERLEEVNRRYDTKVAALKKAKKQLAQELVFQKKELLRQEKEIRKWDQSASFFDFLNGVGITPEENELFTSFQKKLIIPLKRALSKTTRYELARFRREGVGVVFDPLSQRPFLSKSKAVVKQAANQTHQELNQFLAHYLLQSELLEPDLFNTENLWYHEDLAPLIQVARSGHEILEPQQEPLSTPSDLEQRKDLLISLKKSERYVDSVNQDRILALKRAGKEIIEDKSSIYHEKKALLAHNYLMDVIAHGVKRLKLALLPTSQLEEEVNRLAALPRKEWRQELAKEVNDILDRPSRDKEYDNFYERKFKIEETELTEENLPVVARQLYERELEEAEKKKREEREREERLRGRTVGYALTSSSSSSTCRTYYNPLQYNQMIQNQQNQWNAGQQQLQTLKNNFNQQNNYYNNYLAPNATFAPYNPSRW